MEGFSCGIACENGQLREMLALDERRIAAAVQREREEIVKELEAKCGYRVNPSWEQGWEYAKEELIARIKARGEKKPGKIDRIETVRDGRHYSNEDRWEQSDSKFNELIDAVNEIRESGSEGREA
jgi:hypothetical protein